MEDYPAAGSYPESWDKNPWNGDVRTPGWDRFRKALCKYYNLDPETNLPLPEPPEVR